MAHLLIIDLPGGNDPDLLAAALARGDRFSFLTSDLDLYRSQQEVQTLLEHAEAVVHVPGFAPERVDLAVAELHARSRIDAVLTLIDLRLRDAARLAQRLGTRHVTCEVADLLRDKHAVRRQLAWHGLPQPAHRLAKTPDELADAVDALGLPVIIKPIDGYGSIDVVALRSAEDRFAWLLSIDAASMQRTDYGLGVQSQGRWLVERLMEGQVIGCDTLSIGGRHVLVGTHEKLFFDGGSLAIRGGCFHADHPQREAIEACVSGVLDAVGFDVGAAHLEIMLTAQGPRLIELNPRLVGARIPRLVSTALGASLHELLIDVHLDRPPRLPARSDTLYAVTRWIAAPGEGVLAHIDVPHDRPAAVRAVDVLRLPGDRVRAPLENADRLGCVIAAAPTRHEAETAAEDFVQAIGVQLQPAPRRWHSDDPQDSPPGADWPPAPPARAVRVRSNVEITLQGGATARFCSFDGLPGNADHFAVRFGAPLAVPAVPLVRLHSECVTGDVFGSARCDCGQQLHAAMDRLQSEGGVLLYLRQEGRGIGLAAKLQAYQLQDRGLDTFEANRALGMPGDARSYDFAAEMLKALGIGAVRLITNNPDKVSQLERQGIRVVERVSAGTYVSQSNLGYLQAKEQAGHHLAVLPGPAEPRPVHH